MTAPTPTPEAIAGLVEDLRKAHTAWRMYGYQEGMGFLFAQSADALQHLATARNPDAVKYAWLRSEAVLRGAFKNGIAIDAEYDVVLARARALATPSGRG